MPVSAQGVIPSGRVSTVVSAGHRAWPPPEGRALHTGGMAVLRRKQNRPAGLLLSGLCSLGRKKGNKAFYPQAPFQSRRLQEGFGTPTLAPCPGSRWRAAPFTLHFADLRAFVMPRLFSSAPKNPEHSFYSTLRKYQLT